MLNIVLKKTGAIPLIDKQTMLIEDYSRTSLILDIMEISKIEERDSMFFFTITFETGAFKNVFLKYDKINREKTQNRIIGLREKLLNKLNQQSNVHNAANKTN